MLPPFLQSLPSGSTTSIYQNAQFKHKASLGSSHVVWWPPRQAETPDVIVLFIPGQSRHIVVFVTRLDSRSPGNPGLVDFYIPFLSEIYEKLISTNVAILARAHLDHAPQILEHSRRPPSDGLTIQIESCIEILDSILYYTKTRIVVIGHSVGAWISLQVGNISPTDLVPLGPDSSDQVTQSSFQSSHRSFLVISHNKLYRQYT
jgi:Lipid-droplet associated hydrolase